MARIRLDELVADLESVWQTEYSANLDCFRDATRIALKDVFQKSRSVLEFVAAPEYERDLTANRAYLENLESSSEEYVRRCNDYLGSRFCYLSPELDPWEKYHVDVLRFFRDSGDAMLEAMDALRERGEEKLQTFETADVTLDTAARLDEAEGAFRDAAFGNYEQIVFVLQDFDLVRRGHDDFVNAEEVGRRLAGVRSSLSAVLDDWLRTSCQRTLHLLRYPHLPAQSYLRILERSRARDPVLDATPVRPIPGWAIEQAEMILDLDFLALVEMRAAESKERNCLTFDEIGNQMKNVYLSVDEHGIREVIEIQKL